MNEIEMKQAILDAKTEKGLSWKQIGDAADLSTWA